MKKITLAFILLCFHAVAQETNTFYMTDDGLSVSQSRTGDIKLNPEKVEQAKKLKECLPADSFPEGNWGDIQNGFQLSLRFETNRFSTGQPITAILLLRNVTNQVLKYNVASIIGRQGPMAFIATDRDGNSIPAKHQDITVISAHERRLYPRTQHKYIEQLNATYDLQTNGLYYVTAMISVSHPKRAIVSSAKVSIEIEN